MVLMQRVDLEWSGSAIVGPGLSTFWITGGVDNEDIQDIKTFFETIKGFFPPGVTISYPFVGDVVESSTGVLASTWSVAGSTSPTVGGGPSPFAQGVGLRVAWQAAEVHNGHKVRGSTFIVPISSQFYNEQGQVAGQNLAVLSDAAALLRNSSNIGIYSRPTKAGLPGAWSKIVGSYVRPNVSWLRSRRT